MQAKKPHDKINKNFLRTLGKRLCEIRLHYSNKNSEMLQDEQDVGNEEADFRIKNLLS